MKNIVPAIASTNALVAASCVLEALKLATFTGHTMNNYYMYIGAQGLHTTTTEYQRAWRGGVVWCGVWWCSVW